MQVSLNIEDEIYKKVVNVGIDMQTKISEYLLSLADKKEGYRSSKQFKEDKAYFHSALADIESEKTQPLSHQKV